MCTTIQNGTTRSKFMLHFCNTNISTPADNEHYFFCSARRPWVGKVTTKEWPDRTVSSTVVQGQQATYLCLTAWRSEAGCSWVMSQPLIARASSSGSMYAEPTWHTGKHTQQKTHLSEHINVELRSGLCGLLSWPGREVSTHNGRPIRQTSTH